MGSVIACFVGECFGGVLAVVFASLTGGKAIFATVAVAAPTTLAALATAIAFASLFAAILAFARLAALFESLFLVLVVGVLDDVVFLGLHDGLEAGDELGLGPARGDAHLGALVLTLGDDLDAHAIAHFDLGEIGALGVEHVDRRFLAGVERDDAALALGRFVLDHAQGREPGRGGRAHEARAVAVRAGAGRRFQNAGAQALAAHLHQAEARDAADLDARAVVLEGVLHRLLDLADVRAIFHVDEVDHDEAGHVAQAQLAGDFARGFKIGGNGRLLDAVLLGGAARVDVDRDERLGRVDHQIAARTQLDDRIVHRRELVFGAIALEERHRVGILLHPLGVAGHQQLHEVLGRAVARFALDHHFLDVAVVDVADGALDQIAVRMDQRRGRGMERLFADLVPQAGEIVEVALDFGLGALETGGAHDAAHRAGQFQLGNDLLQALAIRGRADLAADAATMARIGHEHAVAARQAQVRGERRALVAAFFLDDLHQQNLTALDHVLDLVATAQGHALGAQFFGFLALATALTTRTAATAAPFGAGLIGPGPVCTAFVGRVFGIVVEAVFDDTALDRGDLILLGRVDFGQALPVFEAVFVVVVAAIVVAAFELAVLVLIAVFGGAQGGFFLGVGGVFGQQRLAVFLGDLVVVGVDFAEGQEAMAIATEIDKGRLERRLYAGDLGEVDVTLDLLVIGRFKVEFFNTVALEHSHPGFFLVARIDQHARGHSILSSRAASGQSPGSWRGFLW